MIFEGYEYFILFLAGFFSGAINTVAGGGSLLTLPILIFMGAGSKSLSNTTNLNTKMVFADLIFFVL